jgi:hypothetical protein
MRYEGRMRHALKRWDMYDDLDLYAIVAEDISDAVAAQSD